MIGNYVKWYGQHAKILSEDFGVATIKVLKTGQVVKTALSTLNASKLQVAEKREKSKKPNTFPHWG